MKDQIIRRRRRTSAEVKKILALFIESGNSAKQFCSEHNLSEAVFYKWRSRHAAKAAVEQNNFVQLKPFSVSLADSALFAEVNGIRIYQVVPAAYLKELLA